MVRSGAIATVLMAAVTAWGRSPNVIIFYADDLGNGDIGCFGAKDVKTPNIDSLAASGIRLRNYYSAAPLCAPSRGALLTGRSPGRAGMSLEGNVSSDLGEGGLRTEEVTFAEIARKKGYATALFGKWHLGSTPDSVPKAQGFDEFFGHYAACIDSYSHMYYASLPYHHDLFHNGKEVWEDGVHMVDLVTRETVRFIKENRERPFVIYVAYNVPHYPMVAPGRFFKMYENLPKARRDWAALTTHMDESMGQILKELRSSGLTNDTFVFFSSDNGAPETSVRGEGGGSNAPYRDYKRSLFDGGVHMPALVSWPGTLPANETRDQLAIATDVLPTIVDLIGAELPKDRTIEGQSWLPFLKDKGKPGPEALFLEWDGQQAVRWGKWKLVKNGYIDQHIKRQTRATGDDAVFLSDVEADLGERTNLAKKHPDIAEKMLQMHEEWRASVRKEAGPPPPVKKKAAAADAAG